MGVRFFMPVNTITIIEIMIQFKTSRMASDGKLNIMCCIIKVIGKNFPAVFKKLENREKPQETGIFTQTQFLTKTIT